MTYRIATNADRNEIEVLFNNHFFPNEPFNTSWIIDVPLAEDLEFTLAELNQEMSIVAIDVETNRIVGACIIGIDTPKATADAIVVETDTTTNKKWAQYLKLYARLDLESDIFRRFNVQESFHMYALVVDANYRCHSIGIQLMERSYQYGASRGYKVCSVNFSSAFTKKKLQSN